MLKITFKPVDTISVDELLKGIPPKHTIALVKNVRDVKRVYFLVFYAGTILIVSSSYIVNGFYTSLDDFFSNYPNDDFYLVKNDELSYFIASNEAIVESSVV